MASILTDIATSNLTGYSVQEDATPLNPGDSTGGVGEIDFTITETYGVEGSVQLSALGIVLNDEWRGTTSGIINDVEGTDGIVSVTADTRLNSLVGTTTAKPMVDTLQNVILYYLSLGGITEGIFIDPIVASRPVAVSGFNDEIWLRLKQLCAVHGAEVSLVSNKVVVRPVRSFESNMEKKTDFTWRVSKGDAAQFVEATYYGNEWLSDTIVFPFTDDERSNVHSWEIPAGATIEDDINLSISLATVQQPIAVDSVPEDFGQADPETHNISGAPIRSVYSIYDSNNHPVTAQWWNNNGGSFVVTINPDTVSVHVKITAPADDISAPYRIVGRDDSAKDAADAADYQSFYLVGSGVYKNPKVLRIPTGIAPSTSVNEVGVTLEVETVATVEDAYTAALSAASYWAGLQQTVSGSLTSINRISGTGSYAYPPISSFNAENANKTIATWNAAWTGKKFSDFNAAEEAKLEDTFENQTFGNVAGARLPFRDAMYRITHASISDEKIDFDAVADTTFKDFDKAFEGKTIADYNKRFAARGFRQFDRVPLAAVDSTGTINVPGNDTVPYPDTFYPDQLYPDGGGIYTGGPQTGVAAPDTFYPDTEYPS